MNSSTPQDQNQTTLRAVAARTAIMISTVGVIVYIALTAAPLAAFGPLAPTPSALPARHAAVPGQPAPQPASGQVPDGYVYPPNSENGNVMTYEHD